MLCNAERFVVNFIVFESSWLSKMFEKDVGCCERAVRRFLTNLSPNIIQFLCVCGSPGVFVRFLGVASLPRGRYRIQLPHLISPSFTLKFGSGQLCLSVFLALSSKLP